MLALASQVLVRDGDAGAGPVCAELNAAVVRLCVGQCQDMAFEERLVVSPDDYLEMAAGKTAALLSSACVLGAMVGRGTQGQIDAMRAFGHHIGLAFQLIDDVLGIFGDPAVTGKPVGADLLRYKKSMPVLAAIASGSPAAEELAEAYRNREVTEPRLPRLVGLLEDTGARERTEEEAVRQHKTALAWLDEVGGDAEAMAGLRALADLVVNRNR